MDAKPQRPPRAFPAVHRDENNVSVTQSTHYRQKSLGNPKTMSTTGALNAPPKRNAFNDVSNLSRGGAMINPAGKDGPKNCVKPTTTQTISVARDVRTADKENLVRAAPLKTLPNGAKSYGGGAPMASTTNAGPAQKRNNGLNQARPLGSLAQPPIKNGGLKRSTMVYQDKKQTDTSARSDVAAALKGALVSADNQSKAPRQYQSQSTLNSHTQSKFAVKEGKLIDIDDNYEDGDIDDDVTDAAYEDAVEQQSYNAASTSYDESLVLQGASLKQTAVTEETEDLILVSGRSETYRHTKALPAPPAIEEPEEYWDGDEDDEQEIYEDQGYTTAHSYRSHGDNTTGGPTTLVAPHANGDVQKELELAKAWVLQTQTEEEIEEEAWDVSMVAQYGDEIFEYLRQLEDQMTPNPHYMEDQTEIQWSMRSVLMDWLVQVHHRFCLLPETLFLTVNYIDRFLSVKVVSLGKLQLVGATALFVAAKYEEINCPSVQEIVYMVDSGYTMDEILKAERFMLSMLQYELGWPGPMSFLRRISKADDYELETRTLAKYFLEVTIMDERFVGCPPSFLAAGAHCTSRMFLEKGEWTLSHVHYSGYTLSQLKPLINMLWECCLDPRKHHAAVYDKYSSPKYKQASTYVESKIGRGVTLPRLYAAMYDADFSSGSDTESPRPHQEAL
ncbi:cyclin-like protein [Podospora australis]|uniref:Cyclin-like protein n=1 Tax=Podospora australis TaxID=1536484 RepID=A0AAN7ALB0_9PEZI|nr:cyclin-like protein [Podospora australis]